MPTPSEIILRKNLVASGLSSAEWTATSAAVRNRAFFASRVESVRFLDTCRTRIAELLDAAKNQDGAVTSRAQVVSDIMRAARTSGIARGTESITDPGSVARASVIVDTNAGMAAGYAAAEQANTFGARLAFPAQELLRIEEREVPRPWANIWRNKGGKLYNGRMIALKDDPIWTAISRFGQPYPPFDFNSGMGVEDVSYDEAVSLGVIKPEYQPLEKSPIKAFNEGLEAELKIGNGDLWKQLKKDLGDQVQLENGVIKFRNEIIREAFNARRPFKLELGCATPAVFERVPDSDMALVLRDTPLVVNQNWLDRKRKKGIDHRDHFEYLQDQPDDIPLTIEDLELLPAIWREPDTVDKVDTTRIMLSMKSLNGGTYKAVVDCGGQTSELITLYKEGSKP